jgi:hypothetical protein
MPAYTPAASSPVVMNGTPLPALDLSLDPAIKREGFRHGGSRFVAALLKLAAQPVITFKTPFLAAYNILGLSTAKLTSFQAVIAKYSDFQRAAGAVHRGYSLNTSCIAAAYIVDASAERGGVLMATVMVIPLSIDGLTAPLIPADTASIPTLGAQTLHTLGPLSVGGTRISGLAGMGYTSGIQLTAEPTDGDVYLRTVAEELANPLLAGTHRDPIGLLTSLGLFGVAIGTAAEAYFRAIDATTGAALGTGLKFAVAAGSVDPGPVKLAVGRPAELGLSIQPVISTDVHPVVVTNGASVP